MKSSRNTAHVDIEYPIKALSPQYVLHFAERLMSRAARSKAIGAGQEILLIDGFQRHRHSALRSLVFEGWNAEHPLRPVRLGM